jgi:nucleotide-binding universal stress UspA family protein
MFRSLLVPLDGSPFGEQALPFALSVARLAGATVQLVHVLVNPHSAVAILEAARAQDLGLIAVETHGHRGLTRIVLAASRIRCCGGPSRRC